MRAGGTQARVILDWSSRRWRLAGLGHLQAHHSRRAARQPQPVLAATFFKPLSLHPFHFSLLLLLLFLPFFFLSFFRCAAFALGRNMQLKDYQLVGVNWLMLLHEKDVNAILADEMGLGKTVQTIAFLAHLRATGCHGPFGIIAPSSTLDNWEREFETWCPQLKVLNLRGTLRPCRPSLSSSFIIVFTQRGA